MPLIPPALPSRPRGLLALWACCILSPATVAEEAPAPPGLRLAIEAPTLLEGEVTVSRKLGGNKPEVTRMGALAFFARRPTGGYLGLRLIRSLPDHGGSAAAADSEDEMLALTSTFRLERPTEGPTRLALEGELPPEEEGSVAAIESILPPEVFHPAFPLELEGSGTKVERTEEVGVSLPAGASARPTLHVVSLRDGAHLEVTRELAEGSRPTFRFRGLETTLTLWREEYHVSTTTGEIERIDRAFAIASDLGGEPFEIRQETTLEPQGPSERETLRALGDALLAVDSAFRAIASAKDIDALLEASRPTLAKPYLKPILNALRARLQSYRALRLGEQVPDFTLEGLDGKPVAFREATKGKVAILSFWGVGCGPCRQEAPHLTRFAEKFASRGLAVIAVNGYDETRDQVADFAKEAELRHTILLMGGKVASELFGVEAYPTLFWVRHDGKIVGREVGFDPALVPALEQRIEGLLADRDKASRP